MKLASRTNFKLFLALALACCALAHVSRARSRVVFRFAAQRTSNVETKQSAKSAADAKTRAAQLKERRERRQAVAVVLEVANDAHALDDLSERAAILSFCADALWDAGAQTARSIFRRAWETATDADEADWKESQPDDGTVDDLPERYTAARNLVLTLAAKHDPQMAEPFMRALGEWLARQGSSRVNASTRSEDLRARALRQFTPGGQRLSLAYSLLNEGAHASAAAVAAPAFAGGVNSDLIVFLLSLRERAGAEEADRLYLRLLAATRADLNADANDALLLSSYIVSPRLLTFINDDGSLQFRPFRAPGADSRDLMTDARTRAAFFDAAAAILLRPARADSSSGDAAARYFAIGRLLPFFGREASQYAPALQSRLSALAAEIEAARRAPLDSQMSRLSLSSPNADDPLRHYLEEIERAGDARSRDATRLAAVDDAARRKLWDRARQFTDDIENEEWRRTSRFIIVARKVGALSEAFAEDEGDDFEKAVAFVRAADLPPALRACGFAKAAELASRRGKHARAASLLEEALGHVQATEKGTVMRDAAALVTATLAARINSPRTWDALASAVAAINEDDEFTDNVVAFDLQSRVELSPYEKDALNEVFQPFSVEELFDASARRDFNRAVAEARNVKDALSRSHALIAAARAALEKSRAAKSEKAR